MGQPRISARRQHEPPSSQVCGSRRMKRATWGSDRRFSTGVSGSELAGNTWGASSSLLRLPGAQSGSGSRAGTQVSSGLTLPGGSARSVFCTKHRLLAHGLCPWVALGSYVFWLGHSSLDQHSQVIRKQPIVKLARTLCSPVLGVRWRGQNCK